MRSRSKHHQHDPCIFYMTNELGKAKAKVVCTSAPSFMHVSSTPITHCTQTHTHWRPCMFGPCESLWPGYFLTWTTLLQQHDHTHSLSLHNALGLAYTHTINRSMHNHSRAFIIVFGPWAFLTAGAKDGNFNISEQYQCTLTTYQLTCITDEKLT